MCSIIYNPEIPKTLHGIWKNNVKENFLLNFSLEKNFL